jgi:glycosyltransferase involved in cell wall biosynthesis
LHLKYGDLITVVVPVFNRANLIGRSVGSLCSQSYRNLEILIVDDQSTDDIGAAVDALQDSRVRLLRRARNGGAAGARNTGIREAAGEWITFHDSDDVCVFDRIERQVQALLSLPPDYVGVHCGRLLYFEMTEEDFAFGKSYLLPTPAQTATFSGDLFPATIKGNFISVPTMLLRKTAIIAAGVFDEKLRNNEDWDFSLRLTRQGKMGFVPDPLYLTIGQRPKVRKESHISLNDHYSAHSFVRITGKLRRNGVAPTELVPHYLSAARFLLRTGRPKAARRFLHRALVTNPLSIPAGRLYLISLFPGFYEKFRRRRKP